MHRSHQTAMLFWTILLCFFCADLVVSQLNAKPGILVESVMLQPLKGKLQNRDPSADVHVIRGLLRPRQNPCPTGYGGCPNSAGRSVLFLSCSSLALPFSFPHAFLSWPLRVARQSTCLSRVCSIWKSFPTDVAQLTLCAVIQAVRASPGLT